MGITSKDILARLEYARKGAGTIPIVADIELLAKYPQAATLHALLLWASYQQDAEQFISLDDIRKNILHWSNDKFFRALSVLEQKGYIQKESTPTGTRIRVFVLPADALRKSENPLRKSENPSPKIGEPPSCEITPRAVCCCP